MAIKRTLTLMLAVALAAGAAGPLVAQSAQNAGVIGGTATDKAKAPYSDYSVRLRSADSRAILRTGALDAQGQFSFSGLALSQPYLVELFDAKANKVICTEGPFALTAQATSRTDVNIDCGKNPMAWLLASAAGAALLAATVQSSSQ